MHQNAFGVRAVPGPLEELTVLPHTLLAGLRGRETPEEIFWEREGEKRGKGRKTKGREGNEEVGRKGENGEGFHTGTSVFLRQALRQPPKWRGITRTCSC